MIWAVVLAVFVGIGWFALRAGDRAAHRRPAMAPAAVAVVTAPVSRADLPIFLDAIGTVTPLTTASLSSQVTGRIDKVHYTEGQFVRRGAPLVDIDPRPFKAQLQQAQGTLERDQHVLAQAQMDLQRYRNAWALHAIAKQQLDDQEKLALQSAATVKFDQGAVDYAKVQLDYAHITSPIDGRVGLRLIDEGNLVVANSGAVLAVITQMRPISVVFPISEDRLGEVRAQPNHGAGLRVDVYDRVRSRRLATGKLLTIDNQIDTTTGTVRLRAEFPNDDEGLFPNQFVNARLLVSTLRQATVVPTATIQHNGQESFVYVIRDGKAHVQTVTAGVVSGDKTQVTGVTPGTVVAASSFEKLREGVPVTVQQPAQPPPEEAPQARR